jgi:hypothetical protein
MGLQAAEAIPRWYRRSHLVPEALLRFGSLQVARVPILSSIRVEHDALGEPFDLRASSTRHVSVERAPVRSRGPFGRGVSNYGSQPRSVPQIEAQDRATGAVIVALGREELLFSVRPMSELAFPDEI